ncbi:MAG: hypothetical protein PSX36_13320 [bacterium]|nr:hypothetical protein [bacterium]
MKKKSIRFVSTDRSFFSVMAFLLVFVLFFSSCNTHSEPHELTKQQPGSLYLNHSDSANYVGMATCRLCHQEIYNTFMETGMGRSFDRALKKKSSGNFSNSLIYDQIANFHYNAFWNQDSLFIKEYRLAHNDTVFSRTEQVNFIIGSGQHTNSHLQIVNGYVNQMPMTYYTQKKKWDLPPGFENGVNTRFSRKIGLECMSCHNAFPGFVMGSENKFTSVPGGIDCERCHGPGSVHVAERKSGTRIDTSKFIDYSIVNPSKLSVDAQFDICQRCHLQGNAVLKEGKSFFDFKPGQKLSDYISVFLPKYEHADDEFIMASHSDRLKQSACFIKSLENRKNSSTLKPYKDALTCITCHNPHVSVKKTNSTVFNEACVKCHSQIPVESKELVRLRVANCGLKGTGPSNCVTCHMPASGSTDIPHVSVHDHYIRKPLGKNEKEKIKKFIGLYSINEKQPDALTRAKAYINQYEKFDPKSEYLDSALTLLDKKGDRQKNSPALIQLYFIKQEFAKVIQLVTSIGESYCYEKLVVSKSYDNRDAWTAYRIGESYSSTHDIRNAEKWLKRAVELAPFYPDFRNKLGSLYASENKLKEAKQEFEFLLKENPRFVSAYSNLGYLKMLEGSYAEALQFYTTGKNLDPDNAALLLNLSAYYLYMNDTKTGRTYLKQVIAHDPLNQRAISMLKQLDN